jgi:hypothetical protein
MGTKTGRIRDINRTGTPTVALVQDREMIWVMMTTAAQVHLRGTVWSSPSGEGAAILALLVHQFIYSLELSKYRVDFLV